MIVHSCNIFVCRCIHVAFVLFYRPGRPIDKPNRKLGFKIQFNRFLCKTNKLHDKLHGGHQERWAFFSHLGSIFTMKRSKMLQEIAERDLVEF